MKFTLSSLLFLTLFSNCKRDYTCYCPDPRIDTVGFHIYATEKNAKEKCAGAKDSNGEGGCTLSGPAFKCY
jgi:hypothetical protein